MIKGTSSNRKDINAATPSSKRHAISSSLPPRGGDALVSKGAQEPSAGTRKKDVESFEDPLQHLWAISYADLLMVILGFFVVFDVTPTKEEKKPEPPPPSIVGKVIDEIIPKLSVVFFGRNLTENQLAGSKDAGDASAQTSTKASPEEVASSKKKGVHLPEVLQEKLTGIGMKEAVEYSDGEIIIHFDENAFASGKFDLDKPLREKLASILRVLMPLKDGMALTFIGHSDSRPLSEPLKQKVLSNMVLSSMRAAMAAELAVSAGFDPRAVMTQGSDAHSRNSRTLTMKISERTQK